MSELVVLAGRQDSQVRGLAAGSGAHQKRPFRCRCRSTTCPVRRHRMETRPSSAAFVRQPSEQPWEREREREKQRLIKVSVQASQQGSGAFCVFYDTKLMLHNPSQRTLIGQPVTTDRPTDDISTHDHHQRRWMCIFVTTCRVGLIIDVERHEHMDGWMALLYLTYTATATTCCRSYDWNETNDREGIGANKFIKTKLPSSCGGSFPSRLWDPKQRVSEWMQFICVYVYSPVDN